MRPAMILVASPTEMTTTPPMRCWVLSASPFWRTCGELRLVIGGGLGYGVGPSACWRLRLFWELQLMGLKYRIRYGRRFGSRFIEPGTPGCAVRSGRVL